MKRFYKICGVSSALFAFAATASAATLSISPSTKTVNVGETFTVSVMLDTTGQNIDGVDLQALNYNPYNLQVIDASSGTSGTQIQAGSLMPNTLANSVDTTNGKIVFSQVTSGGTTYKGAGTLATVTFKALVAGTANINFSFTPGATTDTNVASQGTDVLVLASNGQYSISNVSGSSAGTNTGGTTSGGVGVGVNTTVGIGNNNSGSVPLLTRTLYKSISGNDVIVLQAFLIYQGYLAPGNTSGFFGSLTESGVKQFQSHAGIASSGTPSTTGYGSVGVRTRAAINALLPTLALSLPSGASTGNAGGSSSFTRNLTLGATGNDVRALQIFLNSHGFKIAVSGAGSPGLESTYFGPATVKALIKYQVSVGISPASGFFGPLTRAKVGK